MMPSLRKKLPAQGQDEGQGWRQSSSLTSDSNSKLCSHSFITTERILRHSYRNILDDQIQRYEPPSKTKENWSGSCRCSLQFYFYSTILPCTLPAESYTHWYLRIKTKYCFLFPQKYAIFLLSVESLLSNAVDECSKQYVLFFVGWGNIINTTILPKLVCTSNAIPSKILQVIYKLRKSWWNHAKRAREIMDWGPDSY